MKRTFTYPDGFDAAHHHHHDGDPRRGGRGHSGPGREGDGDFGFDEDHGEREQRGHRRGPRGGRGFGPGGRGFGPEGFGGFGGFGPGGFGPGGFGPGFGGRGGRARNGDVRNAVLSVLSDGANNGYGIIKDIAANSGGTWRVSPGSVYPTLNTLQSEGLIESNGNGRRSEYTLTEAGNDFVEENDEQISAVWERQASESEEHAELGSSIGKLMGAVRPVMMEGSPELSGKVSAILDEARRSIYKLLAE